jgi:hypothetical protein
MFPCILKIDCGKTRVSVGGSYNPFFGRESMKNMLRLAALALMVSAQVGLHAHSGQTFMAPQSTNAHQPAADYAWTRSHKDGADTIGGRAAMRSFFQASTNGKSLGRYFGYQNSNVIQIGGTSDFIADNLIHDQHDNQALEGKLELRPYRQSFGFNLGYEQSLKFIHEDLFMSVNLPVVSTKHSMRARVTDETTQGLPSGNVSPYNQGDTKGILDYFTGNIVQTVQENQAALTAGKFGGKSRTQTGVAGLELNLGWNFIREDAYGLRGRVLTVIPTAPKVTGEYLFESSLGGGRNWQLGLGLDGAVEAYNHDNIRIDLGLSVEAAYQFANNENRIAGLNIDLIAGGSLGDWSQYVFLGEVDKAGVLPAANVLNQSMRVTPGFRFDANLNMNLTWGDFGFAVMYNLHARERESVKVRSWNPELYAVANFDYDSKNDAFVVANDGASELITAANLDTRRAANPSIITNKLGGSLSYSPHFFDNIEMVTSLGGAYEFSSNNASPENWEISTKFGLTF